MQKKMLLSMYAEYFANWITNGRLISRDRISALGLKPVFNRFLTRSYITKAWCIYSIPVHYKSNLSEAIRRKMHDAYPGVKTIIHTYNHPVTINTNDRMYKIQMGHARDAYDKYAVGFSQLKEDEKIAGKRFYLGNGQAVEVNSEQLNKLRENYESYLYVYEMSQGGGGFSETYFFVQASAKSKREIEGYSKRLAGLLNSQQIGFSELKGNIGEYLVNFCPASFMQHATKKTTPMLFSEENLAAQMPYRTKGLVGGSGILIANDWQTKLPFMWNFAETSAAQVVLLCAKSGKGKTYMAFNIAQMAVGAGVHSSAIDIKGDEWIKLAPFVNTKVISVDGDHPCFVNTLRLDDLPANKSNCRDFYTMAVTGTVTLLSLMVNLPENDNRQNDLHMILEKATEKLFSKHEVYANNYRTFYRTKDLNYRELMGIIDDLSTTASYTASQKELCNLIRTRCSIFFNSEGRYSEIFKHEVTVGEILDSPLVVYSFNKNANGELDLLDTIKVFMVQFLDSKKHEIRKQKHLHTFAFYEELQRCQQFGTLLNYISSRVTGSRSSNVSIFLLLNAITVFENKAFGQIKSNITTKIIGKVNDSDIDTLIKDFECEPIAQYLHDINDPTTDAYDNCFAILYDTGKRVDKAIIKVNLPDYMFQQFNTRDRIDFSA